MTPFQCRSICLRQGWWRRTVLWPWSVKIMRGSEHTRWFWCLWVPFQGIYYDDKNTLYEIMHIKGFFLQNSWYLRLIWCTMQNLQWIQDIMKISWKSKEVQDFTSGKINKIWCSFNNQGFCKFGLGWLFDHTAVYCETHMRGKSCRNRSNTEWF